ncbi:MAG: hypothetical protein ACR2K6_04365 [Solirubrobacterales bacterium]
MLLGFLAIFVIGFAVIGFVWSTWKAPLVVAATLALVAVFLVINDGWYGAGWGEFGIQLNLMFAASVQLGVTLGTFAAKLSRRSRPRPLA